MRQKSFRFGVENPFSKIMIEAGYVVTNTQGEDLDEPIGAPNQNRYRYGI
jgi:hypothetical protein